MNSLLTLQLLLLSGVILLMGGNTSGSSSSSWQHCKEVSRNLNVLALNLPTLDKLYIRAKNNYIPRITRDDRCSPSALRNNKEKCLKKILLILQFYKNLLGAKNLLKGFDNSHLSHVKTAKEIMEKLGQHIQKHGIQTDNLQSFMDNFNMEYSWEWTYFPNITVRNLQSFSAMVARVFTPGDPSMHDLE
ncbi:interleukin-23 subunit alpha [Protopterus annectens]|uniref:interleukin-23 subunit alpha n=1 Tax=Protopterus annectens TaxID=7888 RepID=UPI001CFC03E4|nr:interleukin-23 subunit alpha [Protopterus annectens]